MQRRLKVLAVEDCEDDALLLARELRKGGLEAESTRVDTQATLGTALAEGGWDLVLCDFSMPSFSGMAALKLIREHDADVPVIFVSGTMGEDVAVEAMRAGANDYLMKDSLRRLVPAVERELREAVGRREGKQAEATREALLDLAVNLNEASTPVQAARIIFETADRLWDWDSGSLDLYSPEEDQVQPVLNLDVVNGQRCEVPSALTSDEPPPRMRRIMKDGPELILRTPPFERSTDTIMFGDKARPSASIMAVPLRQTGASVGVLSVQSYTPNAFTRDDLHTLQGLADHCGGVLERIRAAAALQQSEARYRELILHQGEGLGIVDPQERITFANPAGEVIFGVPSGGLTGRSLREFTTEAEYARILAQTEKRRAGEKSTYEMEITRPDGENRCILVSAVPQTDAAGQFTGTLGLFLDITERKQAEVALERDEAQLSAIYDHAPLMMCLINNQQEVERMNRAMADLAGPPRPKDTPQHPGDFLGCLHALDDAAGCGAGPHCGTCSLRLALLETFRSGRPQTRVETTLSRSSQGAHSELRVSVSTAFLQISGEPKVLLCLEDITERKRLEAQLLQAQKTEAIGHLAGGVAHDFNNILAAIMMHLGLLQLNPNADEETRQALKELDAEARRAATLTRQLLMFSRRSVLAVKPLDLNELMANLLKMLGRLIGEQIDLRFDGKTGLPSVEADAGMLDQVLMNLVVNARDAMPKGGRITIGTSLAELDEADAAANPERRPGRFVCLAVSDTGCGMDEATLKRVFEPFFTTKEAGKGTGLGLATVHGIVAQHKGWVEVESAVGQGTTFRVFLPALARAAAVATADSQVEPVRRGRETILLVEDDTKVRQMIGQALRVLGYRVYEAANGQEAMALWQTHGVQVELLLTDMVMPEGMTGLELTERLQALRPGLKVIISSGYSAEIVQAGVPTKSGVVYLPKPYEAKTLAEVVRNCLDRKN